MRQAMIDEHRPQEEIEAYVTGGELEGYVKQCLTENPDLALRVISPLVQQFLYQEQIQKSFKGTAWDIESGNVEAQGERKKHEM